MAETVIIDEDEDYVSKPPGGKDDESTFDPEQAAEEEAAKVLEGKLGADGVSAIQTYVDSCIAKAMRKK